MLKKLLQIWLIGIVPTLFFILVPFITGKFEDEGSSAWLWFFLHTLPSIGLLAFIFFKNSRSEALIVAERKFKLFRWLSILYLFVLFITLMAAPFGTTGTIAGLRQSYLWLMPLQLLFVVMFGVVVFGKKLNPDEELFEDDYKEGDYDPSDIHSLLTHNQLGKAFELIKAKKMILAFELAMLENRYHKLQGDRKEGVISHDNAKLEHNQIVSALFKLLTLQKNEE
jgi:hypothetical protein